MFKILVNYNFDEKKKYESNLDFNLKNYTNFNKNIAITYYKLNLYNFLHCRYLELNWPERYFAKWKYIPALIIFLLIIKIFGKKIILYHHNDYSLYLCGIKKKIYLFFIKNFISLHILLNKSNIITLKNLRRFNIRWCFIPRPSYLIKNVRLKKLKTKKTFYLIFGRLIRNTIYNLDYINELFYLAKKHPNINFVVYSSISDKVIINKIDKYKNIIFKNKKISENFLINLIKNSLGIIRFDRTTTNSAILNMCSVFNKNVYFSNNLNNCAKLYNMPILSIKEFPKKKSYQARNISMYSVSKRFENKLKLYFN